MAVEAERGCGYRKAGGMYLVSGPGIGEPCERLPISLAECPCCRRAPIEQTRSSQWVGAQFIFGQALPCDLGDEAAKDTKGHHGHCPLCNESLMAEADPPDKFLILWIGKQHYETPGHWTAEANKMGVSRRISALPKGLVYGKTWVLVAHPEAVDVICKACDGKGWTAEKDSPKRCEACEGKPKSNGAGIFHAFRPRACELVVTPSMKKQQWVKKLVKKHKVELVEVPENDPDHAPTAPRKSARKRAMDKHARKLAKKKPRTTKKGPEMTVA